MKFWTKLAQLGLSGAFNGDGTFTELVALMVQVKEKSTIVCVDIVWGWQTENKILVSIIRLRLFVQSKKKICKVDNAPC